VEQQQKKAQGKNELFDNCGSRKVLFQEVMTTSFKSYMKLVENFFAVTKKEIECSKD
jgi:hypothetical protein